MMLAIQAFALPAAPAPATASKVDESQPSQPEAQVHEEPHVGAAKDKRAVVIYTTSAVVPPYPTLYRYSYVPFYPPVAPTLLF